MPGTARPPASARDRCPAWTARASPPSRRARRRRRRAGKSRSPSAPRRRPTPSSPSPTDCSRWPKRAPRRWSSRAARFAMTRSSRRPTKLAWPWRSPGFATSVTEKTQAFRASPRFHISVAPVLGTPLVRLVLIKVTGCRNRIGWGLAPWGSPRWAQRSGDRVSKRRLGSGWAFGLGVALALAALTTFTNFAQADFTDGVVAWSRISPQAGIRIWRKAAWQDDDFLSAMKLGDVYGDERGDNKYYDPVESYVWYYLATVSSRLGENISDRYARRIISND